MAGVTTALMAAGMAANAIQIADAQKKKQESEFEAKNQAAGDRLRGVSDDPGGSQCST